MSILSVYVPDQDIDRVYAAIAGNYRYPTEVANPNAGQPIITWATSHETNSDLLPIAQQLGYIGELPGTEVQDTFTSSDATAVLSAAQLAGYPGTEIPDPIVFPFLSADTVVIGTHITSMRSPFVGDPNGILGVVTDTTPFRIPNPESIPEFTNKILRTFLTDNVKSHELALARKEAEDLIANVGNVVVVDGSNATVYDYIMVCLEPAKAQYDGLAALLTPGNTFHIPLSASGADPATHYGLEAGITETARQQLLALEYAGGTTTNGTQTLYYVRCDPSTYIAQSTNVPGYDIVGQPCSFAALIAQLGLIEIPTT